MTAAPCVIGASRWRHVRPSMMILHFLSTCNITALTSIRMSCAKAHTGEPGHCTAPEPNTTARAMWQSSEDILSLERHRPRGKETRNCHYAYTRKSNATV